MKRIVALLAFLLLAQPQGWAAWSFISSRGTASEKTSDGSLSLSPTATVPAGSILVIFAATDNPTNTTSCTDTTFHSITLSTGDTCTLVRERTQGTNAAAGVTTSLWACDLTTDLTTSGTVTLNISSDVTAKAVALGEFAVAAGKTFDVSSDQTDSCGSGTDMTTTLDPSGTSVLQIKTGGVEGTTASCGTDNGLSTVGGTATSGGGAASNIALAGRYNISAGSVTHNYICSDSRDFSTVHSALDEVDEGAPPPAEPPLRRQVITRRGGQPTLPAGR